MIERILFFLLTLLIFSLPYEFFFTPVHKGPFSTLKFLVLLYLAAWFVDLLWVRSRRTASLPAAEQPRDLPLPVLLGGGFCGMLLLLAGWAAQDPTHSMKFAGKMVVGWLVSLAVLHVVKGRLRRVRLLLQVFCLNSVLVAWVGLGELWGWQWAGALISFFRSGHFFVGDRLRLAGTLEYPNTAAVFLAQALVVSVFLCLPAGSARGAVQRTRAAWLWTSSFLVILFGLILTYSRGGWFSVAAALLVMALVCWWLGEKAWARSLVVALAGGIALYAAAALYNPYLGLRSESPDPRPFFALAYRFDSDSSLAGEPAGGFLLRPGQVLSVDMVLENRGLMPVEAGSEDSYQLSYLWWDAVGQEMVAEREILTPLPETLPPGESLKVVAKLKTPEREGEFVLMWDLFQPERGWLSDRGLNRKLLPCWLRSAAQHPSGKPERALAYIERYQEGKRAAGLYRSRRQLWTAAAKMFSQHPWTGVGPGNFRLLYGTYLGIPHWDERVHANSLYLEFLADTGVVGTAALFLFLGTIVTCGVKLVRGSADRQLRLLALCVLAVFMTWLAHGIFDYFLDFTPTYLLFWIWVGVLGGLQACRTLPGTC